MIDTINISAIARELLERLPAGPEKLQHEIEKAIRQSIQLTLQKMDLVSREEFDVQAAVLARTREKLETLEKLVHELEQHKG